jgi:fused signal recognition particle receptor
MEPVLYIVIALVVIVVLFLLKGKKTPTAPAKSEAARPVKAPAAKAPAAKEQAPKPKEQAKEAAPREKAPEAAEKAAPEKPPAPPSGQRRRDEPPPPPSSKPKQRDVSELREGLAKSRDSEGFFGRLRSLFSAKKEISADLAEELEEVLLSSDVGVATTASILDRIRSQLSAGELKDEAQVWQALRTEAHRILDVDGASGSLQLDHKPTVVLFVGVNGAGKTTTIGKLATKLQGQGKSCVLAAGDTFRAAAVHQLVAWGGRVGCEVVKGKDGADPGSVIFDAVKKAQELGADVVLADTAGRLHTKSNLMAEMKKIARTTGKALDGAPHEILLVIDATNGQNAMAQAKEFRETLDLSGIVLTKLDGTAKGGVLLGISDSLKLPVRFIGLGERPDDLHEFVADDFIEALLGKES